MRVLVINCGSSSVKVAVVDTVTGARLVSIGIEGIGETQSKLRLENESKAMEDVAGHSVALRQIFTVLETRGLTLQGVGHRIVHGGERFSEPALVDDDIEAAIESLIPLAPLHNPACLAGLRAARRLLPEIPHVAVFDTAFHSTLPPRARAYALPRQMTEELGIRRFGFHGISHEYVAGAAANFLGVELRELRIISCHLGNGCSLAAVEYGRSVETSMGMTPLEGLVMGSRSGDVDPGVIVQMLREHNLSANDLDQLLNQNSGLRGMVGVNDMREIEERAGRGANDARLAIHVFTHRIRKYIGAYAAVMGGVDAIAFTGGIGENSPLIRHRVAQRLDFLGARLDENLNRDANVTDGRTIVEFSERCCRTKLLVVPTDEAQLIAERTALVVEGEQDVRTGHRIPIAISARHVHLTEAAITALFGRGHQLKVDYQLSQPGQFAAEETVTLIGPKRSIENVRVLGPPRDKDQVEISRTDEFYLGLDAPVRASGHIENTPGILLRGAKGAVSLTKGVICAWRHIHMTPEDAEARGVQDGDRVNISVDSEGRDLEFGDVLVRVNPDYNLEMHIDTDEANAAGLDAGDDGVLVSVNQRATMMTKKL